MAGTGQQGASTGSSNRTDIVKSYYPDIFTASYTVPPIHFNRVRSDKWTVPGTEQTVQVQSLPDGHIDDIQADFAQQHVLANLGKLAESRNEVMFIISELEFINYLNREPSENANTLPNPDQEQEPLPAGVRVDGDFDIFIIHRRYGILAGEIKSVGWREPDVGYKTVTQVINKAIRQLKKSEKKVKEMASDVLPDLAVRTTLILPYISSQRLESLLDKNAQMRQNLLTTLNVTSTEEAVQLCLLSDQLSHPDTPWDVTPDVLSKLGAWWDLRMACMEDPLLTDQAYLDFVARLVGPATTITVRSDNQQRIAIEVRTAGDAVAELARRLVTFVLTPEQVGLMNRNPRKICLTGPPGTGKTLMMELQGLRWLLQGRDVHAVSTARTSRAITLHIEHQLNMMLEDNSHAEQVPGNAEQVTGNAEQVTGTVDHLFYDFTKRNGNDVERAIEELLDCVKDGTLHVLMDEVNFNESAPDGKPNQRLVTELARRVPGLHLWAARIGYREVPCGFLGDELTLPLRSAPSVLREVEKAFCEYKTITEYSNEGVPSPADGPCVIPLCHPGPGHSGHWPVDCELCGHNVAVELRRLRVGAEESMVDTCPAPLRYGDVFVLTRSTDLHDDVTDKEGKAIPASGFVHGLRAKGLPVCVMGRTDSTLDRERWDRDMADVAVGNMDKVTVAYSADVLGLERPVVVLLPGRRKGSDDTKSEDWIVAQDRLVAASRAMAQLIVVELRG